MAISIWQQSPAVRRRHVATIGMGVSEDFFGQGVGSVLLAAAIDLAENWMAVTRIELEVYADNQPAIACTENLAL
ncbi:GNAT family N-acetyltransferase [Budvicia aquatica]|uniref:Putative acetyltransferase YhhY n=1 Tax=Budvicia aquatica TaxID=82979 RepID=A0A484ZJ52_9GAMM|nr:putative acetyltransferase YhhY [Budvicia aquatica]